MTRHVQLVVCLVVMLCTEAAFSQASSEVKGNSEAAVSTVPAAYVYARGTFMRAIREFMLTVRQRMGS